MLTRNISASPSSTEFAPPLPQQPAGRGHRTPKNESSNPRRPVPCSVHRRSFSQRQARNHRALFALKVKYLLQILKFQKEEVLLQYVKNVICTFVGLNRRGHPAYTPLEDALEPSLRVTVGNSYWEMAQDRTKLYLRQQMRRKSTSLATSKLAKIAQYPTDSVPI